MPDWSVCLESDYKPTEEECLDIQGKLPADLGPAVSCTRTGTLLVFVSLDAPTAAHAAQSTSSMLWTALHLAGVGAAVSALDVKTVRAREEEEIPLPDLITVPALAKRVGLTEQWVRQMLAEKGAPDPVPVEGGLRSTIYVTQAALSYVNERRATIR